jgi:hypothetical protein
MLVESNNRCLQLGRSIARGSACSDSGSGDLSFMGESVPAGKGMFAARVTSSSISCASWYSGLVCRECDGLIEGCKFNRL